VTALLVASSNAVTVGVGTLGRTTLRAWGAGGVCPTV
jgi:hypothetical protein